MATGKRRGRKSRVASATMRALRGARDLYVRGAKGFGEFIVAANPRAGVGRPTSRAFGVRELNSEQELWELVRATQARTVRWVWARACAAGGGREGGRGGRGRGTGAAWHGTPPLGRIDEDGALV
uniref:Uncharacterized protein n=1 Tax=Oryza brachyantha TaxID=4533 RepID=J3LRK0_ORYBR